MHHYHMEYAKHIRLGQSNHLTYPDLQQKILSFSFSTTALVTFDLCDVSFVYTYSVFKAYNL